VALVVLVVAIAGACGDDAPPGSGAAEELDARDLPAVLEVASPAFVDGAPIPERFTCDGDDLAPSLSWSAVPAGTGSLAIVVDDPDAPGGTFVHWIVTEIPAGTGETTEGQSPGVQHESSFGVDDYRGPCPPRGDDAHTYRFTVYALDSDGTVCGPGEGDACPDPSVDETLDHIAEHVRAEGVLTGTYAR
jgi:Raf kinase inhibitor-like YbhB/YbcL family protein